MKKHLFGKVLGGSTLKKVLVIGGTVVGLAIGAVVLAGVKKDDGVENSDTEANDDVVSLDDHNEE